MTEKLAPNPKEKFGNKKPPLTQFPLSAQIHATIALFDGMLKYGWRNWRDQPVQSQTYIEAAMRHLRLYEVGENYARDTKVHNLGAVIACCAILIDSELYGTMIDNRKKNPAEADLLHEAENMIEALKKLRSE
jgi:hypothetical protein